MPKKGFPKPNTKDLVLKEWRHIDLRESEGARRETTKNLSAVLPNVLKSINFDKKRGEVEVLKVWNNLLNPEITKHAQPANLVRGTLFVNVDNPVWHYQIIQHHRREILARLQSAFGTDLIQRISFRVG